jgi:hypothetical protein
MTFPDDYDTTDDYVAPLLTQTAEDLMNEDLPPIRMVVGDVIPAGLLLLAAQPKTGKSLLLQDLGRCIAAGHPAWGSLPIERGRVLYVANEGGKQSFRDRLVKMLAGQPAPDNFDIAYNSDRLGSGLEDQLRAWLTAHGDARLVVIDTFASVAPTMRGVDRHQEDYKALAGLAALAQEFPAVLVVVVHHTRKSEGEDVMDSISGSNGLTAATDGNAVLRRKTGSKRLVLTIRPRNAEESELTLERGENLCWSVVGNDERAQLSATARAILSLLESSGEPLGPKAIAAHLDEDYDNVRQHLVTMLKGMLVEKVSRGLYVAVKPAT